MGALIMSICVDIDFTVYLFSIRVMDGESSETVTRTGLLEGGGPFPSRWHTLDSLLDRRVREL